MTSIIQFEEEQNHCLIRMDDGKVNALSFDMIGKINAALDQAAETGKAVVITGRPGRFSAGFDLSVMNDKGGAMMELLQQGALLSQRLLAFETPVVLAASGHALAMGAFLLLSVDYRIGVRGSFKIGLNEVAIGLPMPHFGIEIATHRLARTHFERALNLAEIYDVDGAVEAGFLDEVVGADDLLDRAVLMAEQFAGLDREAHRITKARSREVLNALLERAMERDFGTS